jgi:hypothetical protein
MIVAMTVSMSRSSITRNTPNFNKNTLPFS